MTSKKNGRQPKQIMENNLKKLKKIKIEDNLKKNEEEKKTTSTK
jgi:hypothetical protein